MIKKLNLKPYTSVTAESLGEAGNLLENILSSDRSLHPRKIDKPVILYGAGSLGKMAKDFFNYLNIPFLYVVDRNADKYKADTFWQNIKIVHPDDVKETDKKNCLLVVCVVTVPLIALRDELKNNGWRDIAFFYDLSEAYRDQHPLGNGWFVGNFDEKEKESILKIFSLLADDVSCAHYVQFLAWRKLRVELLFSDFKITNDDRFFIPEVAEVLRGDEIFVDCGAHKGFVIEKFLKIVNNKYKAIYAIEPDSDSYKMLEDNLKDISNVKITKCALSDMNGEGKFYQGFDFASKLSENGDKLVKTITLDSLNIPATFIKSHLEGGDLRALKGAINTIRKYRPIVAVTIYHNTDGVWETPFFLMNNAKNYKYYLRLHSWGGTGAVFYAIPEERIK
jgi:FkbM family methyltransferase